MLLLSWQDIQDTVHGRRDVLYRNDIVQAQYDHDKNKNSNIYVRYSDFIKVSILNWDPVQTIDGIIACRKNGSVLHILVPNMYPYHLENGITHMVLWSVLPMTVDAIHKIIRNYAKIQEYTFYINAPRYQSITDLWHVQVFIRN
jgi:hypothetical protein